MHKALRRCAHWALIATRCAGWRWGGTPFHTRTSQLMATPRLEDIVRPKEERLPEKRQYENKEANVTHDSSVHQCWTTSGNEVARHTVVGGALERLGWIKARLDPGPGRPAKVYALEEGVTTTLPAAFNHLSYIALIKS